jgi:23S rRNA pseudouridine955/2504/2580 synthase
VQNFEGFLLHSFRTTLDHPSTGEILDIFAPLPETFLEHLRRIAGDGYDALLHSLAALEPAERNQQMK